MILGYLQFDCIFLLNCKTMTLVTNIYKNVIILASLYLLENISKVLHTNFGFDMKPV